MKINIIEADVVDKFVGKRLRDRRSLLGLSQAKLGSFEELTFQQIQKYESGKNRISAGRLWRFFKILHVPINYFFDGLDDGILNTNICAGITADELRNMRILEENERKVDKELVNLSKSFLKIKDDNMRKGVVDLARGFASCKSGEKPNNKKDDLGDSNKTNNPMN